MIGSVLEGLGCTKSFVQRVLKNKFGYRHLVCFPMWLEDLVQLCFDVFIAFLHWIGENYVIPNSTFHKSEFESMYIK